jgi:hypothetical protein
MKHLAICFGIAAVLLFCDSGSTQDKQTVGAARTAVRSGQQKDGRQAAHRGPVFSGTVVRVDISSGTISVKSRGNVVTFDAANPMFSGYRGLRDIRTNDRVAISYKGDGIRITKSTGKGEPAVREEPQGPRMGKQSKDVTKLQKRERKAAEKGFGDVDANRDGKITAVELSVVVQNITMDDFRKLDRNGDGFLNKAEFLEAVRQQKR